MAEYTRPNGLRNRGGKWKVTEKMKADYNAY
jgi:hypothetical protein